MDWTKNAREENNIKRIAIPVSPEMRKVIDLFKSHYPDVSFSDTKVISTFVEAGVRLWVEDFKDGMAKRARANEKYKVELNPDYDYDDEEFEDDI